MKDFFLVFVALVIPLFFAFVFLMSAWSRLNAGRSRCRAAESEWYLAQEEALREAAGRKWAAAAADFEKARSAFPGRWFAALIGFAPPKPPPVADAPGGPFSVGEGKPAR